MSAGWRTTRTQGGLAALLLSIGATGTVSADSTNAAVDTPSATVIAAAGSLRRIDDNLLAHRLLLQGRAAEAAEIFTDPAWKGIALYRSEQWWRAAEAFVRADDPLSAYNLGNSYVQLGYYALALDAYQRALSGDPYLTDAAYNADLMRQLLASEGREERSAGRSGHENEIDRLDRDPEAPEPEGGKGEDDESSAPTEAQTPEADTDSGSQDGTATPDGVGDGGRTQGGGRSNEHAERRGDGRGEAVGGRAGDPDDADRAGGGSESDAPVSSDQEADGLRAQLEAEQADEQWLNRIQHDPVRFLDKRIRLEMRRRTAAGQSAPAGGDGW